GAPNGRLQLGERCYRVALISYGLFPQPLPWQERGKTLLRPLPEARLRRGQSIGSGLVEGSIKQLVNKRLKQTGARWKVGQVGPLVELGALAAGPEWQAFWDRN